MERMIPWAVLAVLAFRGFICILFPKVSRDS